MDGDTSEEDVQGDQREHQVPQLDLVLLHSHRRPDREAPQVALPERRDSPLSADPASALRHCPGHVENPGAICGSDVSKEYRRASPKGLRAMVDLYHPAILDGNVKRVAREVCYPPLSVERAGHEVGIFRNGEGTKFDVFTIYYTCTLSFPICFPKIWFSKKIKKNKRLVFSPHTSMKDVNINKNTFCRFADCAEY